MTTSTFNEEGFIAALEAAVEEKGPEYIYPDELKGKDRFGYPSCVYFDPEDPTTCRCIIGNALSRIGYTLNDIKIAAQETAATSLFDVNQDVNAEALLKYYGASDALARAAKKAQSFQDEGGSWGGALTRFKAALAESTQGV